MNSFSVISFYRFFSIADSLIPARRKSLQSLGEELGLCGLIILSTEGVNGTVANPLGQNDRFESRLSEIFSGDMVDELPWDFKRSFCEKAPFRDYRVKVRPEIVSTRSPESITVSGNAKKLTASEWHDALKHLDPESTVLLDTRNDYETRLGKFRGALDPGISNFQDFSHFVRNRSIPKEKTILMYCTGGIRCEKASIQMERLGFKEVYQLDGGILRYLEEFPRQEFEGECFVFDNRVALDQDLSPTRKWTFCPHCGDPGQNNVVCKECRSPAKICDKCSEMASRNTCSKNCAYHAERKQRRACEATGRASGSRGAHS